MACSANVWAGTRPSHRWCAMQGMPTAMGTSQMGMAGYAQYAGGAPTARDWAAKRNEPSCTSCTSCTCVLWCLQVSILDMVLVLTGTLIPMEGHLPTVFFNAAPSWKAVENSERFFEAIWLHGRAGAGRWSSAESSEMFWMWSILPLFILISPKGDWGPVKSVKAVAICRASPHRLHRRWPLPELRHHLLLGQKRHQDLKHPDTVTPRWLRTQTMSHQREMNTLWTFYEHVEFCMPSSSALLSCMLSGCELYHGVSLDLLRPLRHICALPESQ